MKYFAQLNFFMNDFTTALSTATTFDNKVNADASAISSDYASIASLSIRQAFGATEVTVGKTSSGGFNSSDVLVFMKG
jgi:hypothetical protein